MVQWFWALIRAIKWIIGGIFALLVALHEATEIWRYAVVYGILGFFSGVWTRILAINEVEWAFIISLVVFLTIFLVVAYDRPRKKMKEEFEQDLSERLEDDEHEHH